MTAATEAAPYSPEEMIRFLGVASGATIEERERAIATAVCLERATNWILAHERDAGVKVITALETVRDALCGQVERPKHYTQGEVECIDAIRAQLSREEYRGFLRGQIAKYNWRLGLKGSAEADALKAQWYLERLVRELGGGK